MAANVNIVLNATDRASGTIKGVAGAIGNILQVATGISLARVFQQLGEGIRSFVVNSIDATAMIQQMQVGIETLIARELRMGDGTLAMKDALEMAIPLADNMMDRLADLAVISPYQLEDVNNTFRQAMAFGFAADEAYLFTDALLNVAAGTGATNERMQRMAYNLSQVRLQGQVTKLDIRQLALAGFDLLAFLQDLGDQMGINIKTHLDFNEALQKGEITWAQFTTGFAKYAQEYFGGASERMARTLFGLKNTFKDVFALTMPTILGPTVDRVVDYINILLDKFIELRDSGVLEEWGENLARIFDEKIAPFFDGIVKFLSGEYSFAELLESFLTAGRGFGGMLAGPLETIFGENYQELLDRFLTGLGEIKDFIVSNVPIIVDGLKQLWDALTGGDVSKESIWEGFISEFERLVDWLQSIPTEYGDEISEMFEDIKTALGNLGDFIREYGPGIWEGITNIFAALLGAEEGNIGDIFGALSDKLVEWSQWLLDNGPEITDVINNFAEALGNLMPHIYDLVSWAVDHGEELIIFFGAFKLITGFLGGLAAGAATVGPFTKAMGWLGSTIGGLWAALTSGGSLAATFGGIAVAVATVILPVLLLAAAVATLVVVIKEKGPEAWNTFLMIAAIITGTLTVLSGMIRDWWTNFKNTWSANWNNLKIIVAEVCYRILTTIASYVGAMWAAGMNLIYAVASGLWAAAGYLYWVASVIASNIAAILRSALRIKSPSGVGFDIGRNFGESIAAGIESAMSTIDRASQRVADAAGGTGGTQMTRVVEARSVNFNAPLYFTQAMTPEKFRALLKEALYG